MTGQLSTFYLECQTARGEKSFIGIEVKYHENLEDQAARHRPEYDKISANGVLWAGHLRFPKTKPLQQIWRDHLLSGAIRAADEFEDALFVVLYPRENDACRKAVEDYRSALIDDSSFGSWILEDVLVFLSENTSDEWPKIVYNRYCNFAKIYDQLV
jgi:hypothetical protein